MPVAVTQAVIEVVMLGPAGAPLTITGAPPAGTLNFPYVFCFSASGGTPPYVFVVSSGSLPPGLVLNPLTGCITGTPTVSGSFTFTVTVTGGGSASVSPTLGIGGVAPFFGGGAGGAGGPTGKSGVTIITRCCNALVLAAERLRVLMLRRKLWPYTDLFPPKVCTPINQIFTIDAPLNNVPTVVLAYQVPSGMRLILQAVIQVKSPLPIAPGDASWTIDVDAPVGIPNFQAMGVQGLTALQGPLGSLQTGKPWSLPRPYTFEPLTVLRSKVTTTAAIPPGPANRFTSGFFGYLIPVVKGVSKQ